MPPKNAKRRAKPVANAETPGDNVPSADVNAPPLACAPETPVQPAFEHAASPSTSATNQRHNGQNPHPDNPPFRACVAADGWLPSRLTWLQSKHPAAHWGRLICTVVVIALALALLAVGVVTAASSLTALAHPADDPMAESIKLESARQLEAQQRMLEELSTQVSNVTTALALSTLEHGKLKQTLADMEASATAMRAFLQLDTLEGASVAPWPPPGGGLTGVLASFLLSRDRALSDMGLSSPVALDCVDTLSDGRSHHSSLRNVGALNAGAAVVALSPVFDPSPLAPLKATLWRWRMPRAARKASKIVLSESTPELGRCVALKGDSDVWIVMKLPRPALLSMASFQHVPHVTSNASSAPSHVQLLAALSTDNRGGRSEGVGPQTEHTVASSLSSADGYTQLADPTVLGAPFQDLTWIELLDARLATPKASNSQGCFRTRASKAVADLVWYRVLQNSGNADYTCLYGLKLLGSFQTAESAERLHLSEM